MKLVDLLKEAIDQSIYQQRYENWERGLIKAWGHLLYIAYHDLPENAPNMVEEMWAKREFVFYEKYSDTDEELRDWMSNTPPTMNGGQPAFDKNRISKFLTGIADKTKLEEPLVIYRYENTSYDQGWNSYTTNINDAKYGGEGISRSSYTLPKGYPVIFASGIADQDEVIVNLSSADKAKFLNKQ